MRADNAITVILAALALPGGAALAAQDKPLTAVLAEPVAIERAEPVAVVPFTRSRHMLVIEARANGVAREFVFDTGSPSMISRELADELGLRTIGSNTGRDANGAEVTMDFVVLDRLEIGGVTFRDVPVLVFDYAAIELGPCLFDGGVIGSEILPGSAWRIDAGAGELSIFAPGAVPAAEEGAVVAPLHRFGYPHAPVIDYRVGEMADRLLFDTGSPDSVVLYDRAAASPAVRAAIRPGSLARGEGSHGVSAGGRGAPGPLERFTLDSFVIGGRQLAPVRATTRVVPPSLVGTGLLASHVVTLDYPGGQAVFAPRADPAPAPAAAEAAEAGYALAIADGAVRVVRLFARSPAARAGLRLGDRIVAIDGVRVPAIGPASRCEAMEWLAGAARPGEAERLTVVRGGRDVVLAIPAG